MLIRVNKSDEAQNLINITVNRLQFTTNDANTAQMLARTVIKDRIRVRDAANVLIQILTTRRRVAATQ